MRRGRTSRRRAPQRLHAAGNAIWGRSRDHQQSATVADLFAEAGLDHDPELLAAYYDFWEPHTHTDPDVGRCSRRCGPTGIKVGVLSNTIWPRAWHEEIFERDGVLDLIDGDVYTSEIPWTKPSPQAFAAAMEAVGVDRPGALRLRRRPALRRHLGRPATPGCGRSTCRTARSRATRSGTPRASRTPSCSRLAEVPEVVARLALSGCRICRFVQCTDVEEHESPRVTVRPAACTLVVRATPGVRPPHRAGRRSGWPGQSGLQRSAYSSAPGNISGVPRNGSSRAAASVRASVDRPATPARPDGGSPPGRRRSTRTAPAPAPAPRRSGRRSCPSPAGGGVRRRGAAPGPGRQRRRSRRSAVAPVAVRLVAARSAAYSAGSAVCGGPRAESAVDVDRGVLGRQRRSAGRRARWSSAGPRGRGGSVARCWAIDADIDASSRARAPLSARPAASTSRARAAARRSLRRRAARASGRRRGAGRGASAPRGQLALERLEVRAGAVVSASDLGARAAGTSGRRRARRRPRQAGQHVVDQGGVASGGLARAPVGAAAASAGDPAARSPDVARVAAEVAAGRRARPRQRTAERRAAAWTGTSGWAARRRPYPAARSGAAAIVSRYRGITRQQHKEVATREPAPGRTPPGTASSRSSPTPWAPWASTSRPSSSPPPASAGCCGSPSTRTAASPSTTSPTRPGGLRACSTTPT